MRFVSIVVLSFTMVVAPKDAVAKLRVVATLPDFAAIAQDLGGERVDVEALLKGTQDPHFADARPSMILAVNRADLLILIGLSLEAGWLPVLMTQSRNPNIQIGAQGYLDASQFITPKEVPARADRAMGDVHSGGNPHFYTAPEELFRVAQAIEQKLIELDPDGRNYFEKRWHEFSDKYSTKSAEWKTRLAPYAGTRVVVYHQSWVYMLDWMGFVRVGALEPKPGVSPSPRHVSQLLGQVKSQGVKFVFQEVYFPTSLSRVFANKAGAKLLVLPSMVGGAPDVMTIWDKFDRIVDEIVGRK